MEHIRKIIKQAFFSSKANYIIQVFLFVNLTNILFFILRLTGLVMIRALVVYDYLLIMILIALRLKPVFTWLIFFLILSQDVLLQISSIYFFSISEFLKNFEFSTLYSFSSFQYIYAIFFLLLAYLTFVAIKRLTFSEKHNKKLLITVSILAFSFIYLLDFLNGYSFFSLKKIVPISKYNIGELVLRNVSATIIDLVIPAQRPITISRSITFRTFENDSSTNQLLIIVESWGMPNQKEDWNVLTKKLIKRGTSNGWRVQIGLTPFKGSTTSAELRELLNAKGDYRYLLSQDSADSFKSIFDIKKEQGYQTIAAHSFTGKMFQRNMWWKNIGIDSMFFLDEAVQAEHLSNEVLNYSNPFASLNDEDTFLFLNNALRHEKTFAYLLTENSHLPFYVKSVTHYDSIAMNFKKSFSEEGLNQLNRVVELLDFFIHHIDKNKWGKVLIVGDHMPPFTKERDRSFYSEKCVPFMVLD